MTVTLSGFADEISADPREQLATLAAESITHLELRSAWSVNVADFTVRQLDEFRARLDDAGVRVSARDSGFKDFVSLEPHLAQAGRYGGFSGPEGFARASQSVKFILNELGISWR